MNRLNFVALDSDSQWPKYLHYPERMQTPFCSRFIDSELTWGATTRLEVNGETHLRVLLRSSRHNIGVVEVIPLEISHEVVKHNLAELLAAIKKKADEVTAKADYQLAAYCASNLWC